MHRICWATVACVLLGSGCGRPPAAKTPDGMVQTSPVIPRWAEELVGKSLADAYPGGQEQCIGFVDKIEARFSGGAGGVQVIGWGWSTSGSRPYEKVVAVDQGGVIRGGGEGGGDRADVPAAIPSVTNTRVGYSATSLQTSGPIRVYGIEGTSACQLGPELAL